MFIQGAGRAQQTYDAIVVGSGISGGWAAKELTEKGLRTLVLERGRDVKHGEYPTHNPIRPEELAATIYHALDIPLNEPQNNSGISRPLTSGKPVLELFG